MFDNRAIRSFAKKIPGARAAAKALGIIPGGGKIKLDPRPSRRTSISDSSLKQLLATKDIEPSAIHRLSQQAAKSLLVLATIEYQRGNFIGALNVAKSILPEAEADPAILAKVWDSLRDLGRYDIALRGLAVKADGIGLNDRVQSRINITLLAQDCYGTLARYLEQYQPDSPKGYVVMFDLGQRIGLLPVLACCRFFGHEVKLA